MVNKPQDMQKCPLCKNIVSFMEIRTCADKDTTEGTKLVHVVVLRCPDCKRIVGPVIPINDQDREQ